MQQVLSQVRHEVPSTDLGVKCKFKKERVAASMVDWVYKPTRSGSILLNEVGSTS